MINIFYIYIYIKKIDKIVFKVILCGSKSWVWVVIFCKYTHTHTHEHGDYISFKFYLICCPSIPLHVWASVHPWYVTFNFFPCIISFSPTILDPGFSPFLFLYFVLSILVLFKDSFKGKYIYIYIYIAFIG